MGALSAQLFDVLLVATVLSIVLAPAVNALAEQVAARLRHQETSPGVSPESPPHAIVCGHGRVGQLVVELMRASGVRVVVVDEDPRLVRRLREDGVEAVVGDAGHQVVLERAGVRHARLLVLCVPDRLTARRAVELAKAVNPELAVLARTHTSTDRELLKKSGATDAIIGEVELALSLSRQALGALRRSGRGHRRRHRDRASRVRRQVGRVAASAWLAEHGPVVGTARRPSLESAPVQPEHITALVTARGARFEPARRPIRSRA